MKDFVNWAILAPGNIASSMALAMKEISKTDKRICLYAVASRDLERAKNFANKWGFTKPYGSYEELVLDKNVDAVYIANPHNFHLESTLLCLQNKKHVLCEKPAGCNINQLNQMIELAQKNNLFFMEAMWTAFNPCIKKVCNFIKSGGIGDTKHIESHFCNRIPYDEKSRMWNPELAGGALLDLGIYNIYVSSLLNDFSSIKNISSNVRLYKNVDAWESVNITYQNNVTASFTCSCDMTSSSNTHDAIIYGTKGFITIQNFFYAQEAEVHTFTNEWGHENKITNIIKEPFIANGYEYELLHATECILNNKTESNIHTFERSRELCKTMDLLRKEWGLKYPFEK